MDRSDRFALLGPAVFRGHCCAGKPKRYVCGNTPRLISCASCHDPNFGWADPHSQPNNVSLGANFTERNSPTVFNGGHNTFSTWDGSTDSVWAVMRPAIEGAPHNFSRVGVAYVICSNATYRSEYEAVFGTTNTTPICGNINTNYCGGASCLPTSGNNWGRNLYTGAVASDGHVDRIFASFGKAIGAYERLIVSKNSAFDRFAEGADSALTASQKRGLKVFIGKGNCVRCHNGPNFSDGKFHNLGVPQLDLFAGSTYDLGRTTGISRVTSTASNSNGFFNTASAFNDNSTLNRVANLTSTAFDIGAFKTPTLRSVNLTLPYFHNGSFNSLWDVVNFYNFAGNAGNFPGTKDPSKSTWYARLRRARSALLLARNQLNSLTRYLLQANHRLMESVKDSLIDVAQKLSSTATYNDAIEAIIVRAI